MSESKSTRAERAKREVESDQTSEAPAQQITDFGALDLTPVNINRYVVTNRSSGTIQTVNLNDRSCTCEDAEYNQGENGACKHLLYAVYHAPRTRDMSDEVLRDAATLLREARDAVEGTTATTSPDPDTTDTADEESDKPPANPDTQAQEEAEAAAETLQASFDEHIEDMQVKAHEGIVWFQTGYDTPDEWPFPGASETFKAVTSPETVMYVHDGTDEWADSPHTHYDDKPGQYFKNALYPSDVETYVEAMGL